MSKVASDSVSEEFPPVKLRPGDTTVRMDSRGEWVQDEYILRTVGDTMGCRGRHFVARRINGGTGRLICFDSASMVRKELRT